VPSLREVEADEKWFAREEGESALPLLTTPTKPNGLARHFFGRVLAPTLHD
jgi:hypothetical protein